MDSKNITIAREIELEFSNCRDRIAQAREDVENAARDQNLRQLYDVTTTFISDMENKFEKIHSMQTQLLDLATEIAIKNTDLYMAIKHTFVTDDRK